MDRWIRADANDTAIIEDTRKDLVGYLERQHKSDLTDLQKCWDLGYQYMVLPKMEWTLAIYYIPMSTVQRWEQITNGFLRVGAGHTPSRLCLLSSDSVVAIPIDSLMDT